MQAEVVMRSLNAGYTEDPELFTIGGYEFIIAGEHVHFDWVYMAGNASVDSDGRITIDAELSTFDESFYQNSDCSITADKVTPAFLASATMIDDLYYACYADVGEKVSIELELVSFKIDERFVDQDVIDRYNHNIAAETTPDVKEEVLK